MDIICRELANDMIYGYHAGRFWRWDDARNIWKESHLMAQKFERARAALETLTPETFFSDDTGFALLDEYEIPFDMAEALKNAKPCKNAPIEPVEDDAPAACICSTCTCGGCKEECFGHCHDCGHPVQECNSYQTEGEKHLTAAHSADVAEQFGNIPAAPSFDFGADDQTNALLLQDAQTFITGNMARIMAAKHAHDLCANNKNGTWGRWCSVVGISRDTGDNMVHIAEQFGNIQIDGQSIFDIRPMKLLYAAAKPSTPQEVKQAVFSGDITTYKEYQELLAQLKAEKERADTAEHQLDAVRADVTGLHEQVHAAEAREEEAWKLQAKAEQRAKDAESQLTGSRQVAEAAKRRADKWQAEAEAAKKQPIEAVVDEEEVDKRAGEKAYQIAADMTADLRSQLEQATSGSEQDARNAYDSIILAGRSITNLAQSIKPLFGKLSGEQRENAINQFVRTLGQIQGEVSRCL